MIKNKTEAIQVITESIVTFNDLKRLSASSKEIKTRLYELQDYILKSDNSKIIKALSYVIDSVAQSNLKNSTQLCNSLIDLTIALEND